MAEDRVRVIRIIEYIGPRSMIEEAVARSIHGTKEFRQGCRINAATLGTFPEILDSAIEVEAQEQRLKGE